MGIPLNDADVSTVVDVLVSHGLAMLSALVDQGSRCIMANRAVMAWMLSALPVVCRQGTNGSPRTHTSVPFNAL